MYICIKIKVSMISIRKKKITILLSLMIYTFSWNISNAKQPNDTLSYEPDDDEYNLVIASLKGDLSMVQKLIDKGINPNIALDESITPLMYAIQGGNIQVINFLIARGADINYRPINGSTPLIVAVKSQRTFIVEMLINMGAKIDGSDYLGRTPLMYSIAQNDTMMFGILKNLKANINATDTFGITPLMVAVIHHNYNLAEKILQLGVNPNIGDKKGITPLIIAVSNSDYNAMELLLKYGADINIVSHKRHSPITIAIEKQDERLIEYLIEKGADVNLKLGKTETPLSVVKYFHSNIFIEEMLTAKGAKQSIWPIFRQIAFGPEFLGNFQHFMLGFNTGLKDFRYDSEISGGFLFRPAYTRVLVPADKPNVYYQFWESRILYYLAFDKNFLIKYIPSLSKIKGISIGIRWNNSYDSYRGATWNNSWKQTWSIKTGYYYMFKNIKLYLSYQYIDFKKQGVSPHHYNFGISFYFGRSIHFDNKNYQTWY